MTSRYTLGKCVLSKAIYYTALQTDAVKKNDAPLPCASKISPMLYLVNRQKVIGREQSFTGTSFGS